MVPEITASSGSLRLCGRLAAGLAGLPASGPAPGAAGLPGRVPAKLFAQTPNPSLLVLGEWTSNPSPVSVSGESGEPGRRRQEPRRRDPGWGSDEGDRRGLKDCKTTQPLQPPKLSPRIRDPSSRTLAEPRPPGPALSL